MCRPIDSNFSDRGAFNNSAVALLASIPQVSSNFAFDLALAPSASNSEEWLDNFHFSVPEISPPNTTSWSVNKAKATSRSKPEENNIGAVYETDENPFKKIHTQVGPDSISIDGCGRYSTVPVPAPTQYAGHTHHFNATLDNRSEMSHIETYHGARKEQGTLFENNFDVTDTDISLLYNILIDTPEEKNTSDCELTGNKEKTELNLLEWQGHVHDSSRSLMALEGTRFSAPSPAATSFPVEEVTHENKNRRLCKHEGCLKRCRSNGRCISHGGGQRCSYDGCNKSSQGGNLCIRHGGGKRCSIEGCGKAAQSKYLCKAHGGGPRCQYDGCYRSSQGGGFCRCHGGGKRCMMKGCNKGTQRGVHCAAHGGSRLCEYPGCTRNDRGGGFCATHGGGRRCQITNCLNPCRRKSLCSKHLRQQMCGRRSKQDSD